MKNALLVCSFLIQNTIMRRPVLWAVVLTYLIASYFAVLAIEARHPMRMCHESPKPSATSGKTELAFGSLAQSHAGVSSMDR